jgi:AcrR family transcriptional regulator
MTVYTTGGPSAAQLTRQRLLDAAERLFAEHGFEGTSMRALTTQAGTNLAAVNYHFGSKEALFEAVFTRRFAPINAERLRLLDEFETRRGAAPLRVEEWLEALIGPPLRECSRQGANAARLLALIGRMHGETGELQRRVCERAFAEVRDRFLPALRRSLGEPPEIELYWRMHFVIAALANVMASQSRLALLSRGQCDGTDVEETLRRLVPFLAAGMRASLENGASR